jgi:hypothetical protein
VTKISNLVSRLYLRIDESNHGRFDEVFSMTYSLDPNFALFEKGKIPKRRHHKDYFLKELLQLGIDYNFLLLSKENYMRIPKEKLPGIVVASLIKDLPKSELNMFIDRKLFSPEDNFMRKLIIKRFSMDPNLLKIQSRDKFDEHYPIVNLADELAHYLFRSCTLDVLTKDKHRKELLLDLVAFPI